jgi:hypothetical protein
MITARLSLKSLVLEIYQGRELLVRMLRKEKKKKKSQKKVCRRRDIGG